VQRQHRLLSNRSGIATLTALAITGLVVAVVVVGAVAYSSLRIQGRGSIAKINLEIYADEAGTKIVNAIDWGIISPGGRSEVTIYIKILGNVPANLSVTTSNWNPSGAQQYMTLSWDYNNVPVVPDEIRPVKLTLSISEAITGVTDFSFDMTFVASQTK